MDKQLEKEATDYAYGEYEGSHAAVSRSSYIAGATSSSTVKNLEREVEYWKERCEAAELVIVSMECGLTKLPTREAELNHESAYNNWIESKNHDS